MAFEDLRERLRDQASEALAKIQETSAFNTLRERYESQTPPVQKAITMAGIGFFVLIMASCPMSYISSSSDNLAVFEENRELIQGLLRASRSAKEPSTVPPPMPFDSLRASVDSTLRQNGLMPDQVGEMNTIPESEIKHLAPPGVVTAGIAARAKKLNLQQVIEIGNLIQNMAPGIKLLGLDIQQSAGTTHYYDIVLRIAAFGLPAFENSEPEPAGGGKRPPPRGRPKDDGDDL